MHTRRQLLITTGSALTTATLPGCTSSTNNQSQVDGDIIVGPDNELVFDPETLTISTGKQVTWGFASTDHNVSWNPNHSDHTSLPETAEAFASYDGDNKYQTKGIGTRFSHTFHTPGTYT